MCWENRSALFPGQVSYKETKPGCVCPLSHHRFFECVFVLFIRATFCIALVCICMFCLLVVLVKLSIFDKWLSRKIHLRMPNYGKQTMSTKPMLRSTYDFISLVYCFIVLLCVWFVPWPYVIYFVLLWHCYSHFVLKVPINTNQPSLCSTFCQILRTEVLQLLARNAWTGHYVVMLGTCV